MESEQGFAEQWRAIYIDLPPDIQQQFMARPLPFGFSALEWGSILENLLPLAAVPATGEQHSQLEVLIQAGLGADADPATHAGVKTYFEQFTQAESDEFQDRAYLAITCHELAEDAPTGFSLGSNGLTVVGYDCRDVALDRPYAASAWPITAPIYYYTGTNDPTTPPWQTDVHYSLESKAARSLVHVTGAGHNALHLNLTDCMPALWTAMVANAGIEAALESCAWPTEILRSP
jgi:pimeloyl-ACP methyl ester carboxylesterase